MGHDRECSRVVLARTEGGVECVKCGAYWPDPEEGGDR